MKHVLRSTITLILTTAFPLAAQDRFPPDPVLPTERPVHVMLVAVFHLAQTDTTEFDILDAQRQAEADSVVARLAQFRPTKVMVEWQPYFQQRIVDSTYALYRQDRFRLSRNEVHQLGFRLARRAGLERVWAIDHAGLWLGDSLRTVATAMGQLDLIEGGAPFTRSNPRDAVRNDALYSRATLADILRWMSAPAFQALMYDGYVNALARVGIVSGDDFDLEENEIGAELLSQWVRRNIKIYRHVLARTDYLAQDRIVIFIGADHVQPLRQFFEANLNFKVVEVGDYL